MVNYVVEHNIKLIKDYTVDAAYWIHGLLTNSPIGPFPICTHINTEKNNYLLDSLHRLIRG